MWVLSFILSLHHSNVTTIKTIEIMTTSNETITVTPNHLKRTFTIRKYVDSKIFTKYRTVEMNQDDFDSEEMNTENDWRYFLRNTNNYYIV